MTDDLYKYTDSDGDTIIISDDCDALTPEDHYVVTIDERHSGDVTQAYIPKELINLPEKDVLEDARIITYTTRFTGDSVLTLVKFDDKWYNTSTGKQYSKEDVRDIFHDPVVCSAKVISTVDLDKD